LGPFLKGTFGVFKPPPITTDWTQEGRKLKRNPLKVPKKEKGNSLSPT